MDFNLMELAQLNSALLEYRFQLGDKQLTAVSPGEKLRTSVLVKSVDSALVKVQDEIHRQTGTYR